MELEEAKHVLGMIAGRESGITTATLNRDAARVILDHLAAQGEPSDATHAAETIVEHQPYIPVNGGYGCVACGVEMKSWQAFSGHLARAVERAALRAAAAVPDHHVDVHDDPAAVTNQGENRHG